MIGLAFGHYEIREKLGAGGMGVVYKARDTRLERFVAIKVLPPDRIADPARKQRFIQEARTASALNHPNIVTVHDIASENGVDYIVMEFVNGQTLASLIGRKGMPLPDMLAIAIQVADALSRAHAAGIVHRDVKPGNIMVTRDGLVKVLDFGLAKLIEQSPLADDEATQSVSPVTDEGVIIGTAAYMSPEQAEGREVDSRSDIFSFGAVLYEMVTGRSVFQRESKVSTVAAILRDDAPPLGSGLPRELDRIISQCLRKPARRRFQHMADLKVELETLKEDSDTGKLTLPPASTFSGGGRQRWLWVGAPVVAVLAGLAGWYFFMSTPLASPERTALRRLTADAGLTTHPVISPDGKWLAYASDRESDGNLDIWIQQIQSGERRRLTSNPADEHELSFSPDGSRIGYRSEQDGGGIWTVSILGGEPRRVVQHGRRPRFSPDGTQIAYWIGGYSSNAIVQGRLFVVPANGGEPKPIRPERTDAGFPEWSPDGSRLLFCTEDPTQLPESLRTTWWTTEVREGGESIDAGLTRVLRDRRLMVTLGMLSSITWTADGPQQSRIVFSALFGDSTSIWSVPLSHRTWNVSGPPEQLTSGSALEQFPSVAGRLLVFMSARTNTGIWSLPLAANRVTVTGGPVRLTEEETSETHPMISEDGRKLAFALTPGIRMRDRQTGKEEWVSRTSQDTGALSRDGRWLAYNEMLEGGKVSRTFLRGDGDPVAICDDCFVPTSVSRDGSMVLDEGDATARVISVVVTARRQRIPIIRHEKWTPSAGQFSPDERWIVFHTVNSATSRQIFVAPFRGTTPVEQREWIPITDGNTLDRYGDWSPDGNTLYFLSERDGFRCIRAQRLDLATKHPKGPSVDVYHFHHARRSLLTMGDPIGVNLRIAADRAVFGLAENTGNIWLATLPEPQ